MSLTEGLGVIGLIVLCCVLLVGAYALNYFLAAASTAGKELSPDALLKKYTWFKDASAALDKKVADVRVYQGRIDAMDKTYANVSRRDWPRTDLEQYNVWSTEVAGIKASYNTLAADYNSKMAEINWQFTNVGELPKGATEPLPREYKPYIDA